MKIAIFSLAGIPLGKQSVKDSRLDQVDAITKSKKKTYLQVELIGEDALLDAQAVLASSEARTDLILRDLEFVETRLARAEQEQEKALLQKLKSVLEKETFIVNSGLSEEEKKALSGYGLLTNQPVIIAEKEAMNNLNALLTRVLQESGFISFFTTGEKETRAWLIAQGTTAWEAAGCVHSDIQKGFIRAEIISFTDFIQAGGENQAKQAGKLRLEPKEYIVQDADLVNFRFNK
jgi:ribosome-binding ATPase YchF (GTP1/OBG family)